MATKSSQKIDGVEVTETIQGGDVKFKADGKTIKSISQTKNSRADPGIYLISSGDLKYLRTPDLNLSKTVIFTNSITGQAVSIKATNTRGKIKLPDAAAAASGGVAEVINEIPAAGPSAVSSNEKKGIRIEEVVGATAARGGSGGNGGGAGGGGGPNNVVNNKRSAAQLASIPISTGTSNVNNPSQAAASKGAGNGGNNKLNNYTFEYEVNRQINGAKNNSTGTLKTIFPDSKIYFNLNSYTKWGDSATEVPITFKQDNILYSILKKNMVGKIRDIKSEGEQSSASSSSRISSRVGGAGGNNSLASLETGNENKIKSLPPSASGASDGGRGKVFIPTQTIIIQKFPPTAEEIESLEVYLKSCKTIYDTLQENFEEISTGAVLQEIINNTKALTKYNEKREYNSYTNMKDNFKNKTFNDNETAIKVLFTAAKEKYTEFLKELEALKNKLKTNKINTNLLINSLVSIIKNIQTIESNFNNVLDDFNKKTINNITLKLGPIRTNLILLLRNSRLLNGTIDKQLTISPIRPKGEIVTITPGSTMNKLVNEKTEIMKTILIQYKAYLKIMILHYYVDLINKEINPIKNRNYASIKNNLGIINQLQIDYELIERNKKLLQSIKDFISSPLINAANNVLFPIGTAQVQVITKYSTDLNTEMIASNTKYKANKAAFIANVTKKIEASKGVIQKSQNSLINIAEQAAKNIKSASVTIEKTYTNTKSLIKLMNDKNSFKNNYEKFMTIYEKLGPIKNLAEKTISDFMKCIDDAIKTDTSGRTALGLPPHAPKLSNKNKAKANSTAGAGI